MLREITEITLLEALLERYDGDVPRSEIIRMIVERQVAIAVEEEKLVRHEQAKANTQV